MAEIGGSQKRFIRRGVAKIFYLPAVADPEVGPTRAEIAAGSEITKAVAGITGFATTSTSVPTPDMGSRFESSIPGNITVSDSSLRLYDDEMTEDVEDLFPVDDEAFVYFMRKGDKPATPTGDLYRTRVSSRTANWVADMTPADVTVSFSISSEPWLDRVIPAVTP